MEKRTTVRMYVLDVFYKVVEEKAIVMLFGKTPEGKHLCLVDRDFEPYFYAVPKGNNALHEEIRDITVEKGGNLYKVTKVESVKKKLLGDTINVLKVYVNLPKGVPLIRSEVKNISGIKKTFEYDIKFAKRYIIDKGIFPMSLVESDVVPDTLKMRVPVFRTFSIRPVNEETLNDPKILAFDIETYSTNRKIDPEENPIMMISFYGKDFKKVVSWRKFEPELEYLEFVGSEAELIEKAVKTIKDVSPDMLCGYYSDGFDFPYLQARAKKHKILLDIGIDNSGVRIKRGNIPRAEIHGMIHLDIINFVRKVVSKRLETESYSLDNVAYELLGEKKIKLDMDEMISAWDSSSNKLNELAEYNLKDSELAFRITKKLLPNILELVRIVGMPISDVTRMGFSQLIEWILVRNAYENNDLIPNKPGYEEIRERRMHTFQGAFVYEPKPGLYNNIVVYDFKSLYPTIISSHNISIDTLNCKCCPENKVPGESYWFCTKKKGFIPRIIEDMITRRMRVKELMKDKDNSLLRARSETLKLLANSFYGYLGFFGARWYSLESAISVTAYSRHYIHKTIEKAEKDGFKVIYSDTDSVFIALEDKSLKDAERFAEEVNQQLPGLMELEYDGFYVSGIFVAAKGAESGAKKRYALLKEDGNIVIKGFETIRQNWSIIGKEAQREVLKIVLNKKDGKEALAYSKRVISDLRAHKIPVSKMVLFTQLQKEIEEYDSVGPHVKAAMRMKSKGIGVGAGSLIKYVIIKGKGRIGDRARLPEEVAQDEYDAEYYINNQIIPSVERILNVFGYSKEDLLENNEQSKLEKFF